MFLWIVGSLQLVRQAEDRFTRSMETVSHKFDKVLSSVLKLAIDIIRPWTLNSQWCTKDYRALGLLHSSTIV
jgi:hypothetical protein